MGLHALDIPGLVLDVELGHGAYSVVYRAHRDGKACAVKIARRVSGAARWFRREAAALARVKHPGVPSVLDVGEIDRLPYLVMELVEGETLDARLERSPLSLSEILTLGSDLADIARAVHDRGLVHRDIKPRNIVLDRSGSVHLVDFGLVTQVHPQLDVAEQAGTRTFAAPEQLRAPQLVDARADLYAIGQVVHACLAAARLAAPVPVAEVLQHVVAVDPADRYPSARAFADDLARAIAGDPLRGPGPSARPEASGPLVGREREVERLQRAWTAARDGQGSVIILEGPPGSGKTCLLGAFIAEVETSGFGALLRTEGALSLPFGAVRALVDRWLDRIAQMPAPTAAARLAALRHACAGPAQPMLASISSRLANALGDPEPAAEREHEAFVEAVAALIVKLANVGGPMLLVIDDLQWLDPVSREILVRVALETQDAPLLFLAAARSDARSLPPVQRFTRSLGHDHLDVVAMSRLSEHDLRTLVSEHLSWPELDDGLLRLVVGLCDGTPLGAIEILGALVDSGALRPHWGSWRFDAALAEMTRLPVATTGLLDRRMRRLPPATLTVLEAAAILGPWVDVPLIAGVAGLTADDVGFALIDAGRAALVELDRGGRPRFVHESVREAILRPLGEQQRRRLHQRAAEVMDEGGDEPRLSLVIADHYAEGEPERTPARACHVATLAARQAASELDHESALRCFDLAERMAAVADIALDGAFWRGQAESRIRGGALDESLTPLRRALVLAHGLLERSELLGRIAWVYQALADPDRAWATLDEAFRLLGEAMPTESPPAIVRTLGRALGARASERLHRQIPAAERPRLELLCALHYQNGRLGVEYSKPLRTFQAALTILATGKRLGESPTFARAMVTYGVGMTTLGRKRTGRRYLAAGQQMAERLRDPSAIAYTVQMASMGAGWAGDFEKAIELCGVCLDTYGPWLEVAEFCLIAASSSMAERLRGRPREAMAWSRRAAARVRRHGRAPAAFVHVVAVGVRASLVTLGREHKGHHLLLEDLAHSPDQQRNRGFHRLCAWGPRALEIVESGRTPDELDALVEEFALERHDPRRAHIALAEYYVAVAHGYAQRCLSGATARLPGTRRRFEHALVELQKAARVPLVLGHLRALQGIKAVLDGEPSAARDAFAEAQMLGERETAPWVLYMVARGQAHLLRNEGKLDAARDRAKVAALFAREHGAVHRQRWVEHEFGLPAETTGTTRARDGSSHSSTSTRSGRQLRALLDVARAAGREQKLSRQSRVVLDEIVRAVQGSAGLLLFERPGTTKRVLQGRTGNGHEWEPTDRALLKLLSRVCDAGVPLHEDASIVADLGLAMEPSHMLCVPLMLQDQPCGALYVERHPGKPGFKLGDIDLVTALAPQVPATLELARLLEEREQLETDLRRAQRMEAVGQLASGIAHDFNNMLTAIRSSLELLGGSDDEEDRQESIATIFAAYERAAQLTQQLLAFSRRQVLETSVIDLGAAVIDLAGIVRRLVGPSIEVEVASPKSAVKVRTDRSSLEQALVNLAANARDAMPVGGKLRIAVEEVMFDETWLVRGAVAIGRHACIEISDTGVGMPREILDKIFEPFFTTKEVGQGTGLGLASVYGFVTQAGGHIEVTSEVGSGSVFRIYLPASSEEPITVPPDLPAPLRQGTATILVVDDDPLVRRSVATALGHQGYTVFDVANGQAAIAHIQAEGTVDLVVTDVVMPVMSGPELARQLERAGIQIPVLFVSGYPNDDLVEQGVLREGVEYLRKPFATAELLDRIRALLPQRAANVGVR